MVKWSKPVKSVTLAISKWTQMARSAVEGRFVSGVFRVEVKREEKQGNGANRLEAINTFQLPPVCVPTVRSLF